MPTANQSDKKSFCLPYARVLFTPCCLDPKPHLLLGIYSWQCLRPTDSYQAAEPSPWQRGSLQELRLCYVCYVGGKQRMLVQNWAD